MTNPSKVAPPHSAGRRAWFAFAGLLVAVACSSTAAGAAQLESVRLLVEPCTAGAVKAVLAMTSAPHVHAFVLRNPSRLVVDLLGDSANPSIAREPHRRGVVTDVRLGRHRGATRVVFDLSKPVRFAESVRSVSAHYGHRLILEITPDATDARAARNEASRVACAPGRAAHGSRQALRRVTPRIVVAIDPGHGGRDPGARGPDGVEEKTITMKIARRLARLIDAQPHMRAVLTRRGDDYVGLRQRIEIARKAHADLFVSIHCNASPDPSVEGTAVYMLSEHGANSAQARWVADRENAAGMVGGMTIHGTSDRLASVLVDISQSAAMDASADLAHRLLRQMETISPAWEAHIQRAAFVVLKAPDIPSVLVETDFITTPHEERLLENNGYQEKIARRLAAGIRGYFRHYEPRPQPILAASGASGESSTRYAKPAASADAAG